MNAARTTPASGRWLAETLIVYRFVIVGLVAAAVHVGVAWTLIVHFDTSPMAANFSGFGLAFATSFIGQYVWTFRSSRRLIDAILRFALISAGAFGVNNLLLWSVLHENLVPAPAATVAAACVIPAVSYLGNRFWALT
ncbi:MAG: GtrA family protein [Caldilineaceae bacterium]